MERFIFISTCPDFKGIIQKDNMQNIMVVEQEKVKHVAANSFAYDI